MPRRSSQQVVVTAHYSDGTADPVVMKISILSGGKVLGPVTLNLKFALASLKGAASSATDNPCSVDEAKAKIAEARAVIQELEGTPAANAEAKAPAKPAAAKTTTAKKK